MFRSRRATPAPSTASRRKARPSLESLEARSLLSADLTAVWAASDPVAPATSALVRFLDGTPAAEVSETLDAVGGRVVRAYPGGPALVALPPWVDRDAAIEALEADDDVTYAEPNATFHAEGTRVVPNDPRSNQQWGLSMIDAPDAWGITTGSSSTIVAVLDTGIDTRSPEFSGRLWVNTQASNRFRTAYGWNFVGNNANVNDDNGHGTHVSGILGATGNNASGIAGLNWNAKIMPLKVLDSRGDGSTDAAVNAIYFAVDKGARVINASWGGDVYSQAMNDAMAYANARGVVFVSAAGNEGVNNDISPSFPASYRLPNMLSVASVDAAGNMPLDSNYGATTVDLAAPGEGITSTVPGGYDTYSGTSMATAFVSGTVSLLVGLRPDLNAAQLVERVRATAKPLAGLAGRVISGGVVDPFYALTDRRTGAATPGITPVEGRTSYADLQAVLLTIDEVYNGFGGTPESYVSGIYQALRGRVPRADEVQYVAGLLRSGASRLSVFRQVQNDPESFQTRVARYYRDEYGWDAPLATLKSSPDIIWWAARLAEVFPDNEFRVILLSSDSYFARLGGTNTAFVNAIYRAVRGRAPDASELTFHVARLNAGASREPLVRALIYSVEGQLTTMARFYQEQFGWGESLDTLRGNSGVAFWAKYLPL